MQRITNRMILCGALTLSTLAGMAHKASADECCRWELKTSSFADGSALVNVELWAHIPDDAYAFASGEVTIRSPGVDWVSWDTCGPISTSFYPGILTGSGDIEDISASQLNLPVASVYAVDDNPILIWCGQFEAPSSGFVSLSTESSGSTFYPRRDSPDSVSCGTVRESARTIYIGPDIFGTWFSAYGRTTRGTPEGDGVVLRAAAGSVGVEASLSMVETDRQDVPFEIKVGPIDTFEPIEFEWFTWWRCFEYLTSGKMGCSMVLEDDPTGEQALVVSPDFGELGVERIPLQLLEGERVVATPTLPAGGSFKVINPCTSLTFCYVPNGDGQLVLVLKCDSLFDIEIAGARFSADRVAMQTGIGHEAMDGLDHVQISAPGSSSLTIVDAGPVETGCRADCDGDGRLSIFDFLCYQNLFASGDLAADFDGDGRLTIFDFLAFQNEFVAGCA